MPYRTANQNSQINLMNQMINTQSSKNITSMSEQNTVLKTNLASGNDSNTQSKLSVKQQNMPNGK
jgi:hypothetical protein